MNACKPASFDVRADVFVGAREEVSGRQPKERAAMTAAEDCKKRRLEGGAALSIKDDISETYFEWRRRVHDAAFCPLRSVPV
jgi:hypothetical protein